MANQAFDPYYEWLGIPPKEQPPSHYRLLGIALFEENAAVIENAADRIIPQLRNYQAGKHSAESQSLLNEVTKAKLCLLKPEKKSAYDEQLRLSLPTEQPVPADGLAEVASLVEEFEAEHHAAARAKGGGKSSLLLAVGGLVIAAAAVGGLLVLRNKQRAAPPVAQQAAPITTVPPSAAPAEPKPAPSAPAEQVPLAITWPLDEREGGAVEIDGQIPDPAAVSHNPTAPTEIKVKLAAGRHVLRLTRTGYESYLTIVQSEAGKTQQVRPTWRARPTSADGRGLVAVLYEGEDFDTPLMERIDPRVDWLWGYAPPEQAVRNDDFSIRWTGWLKAPAAGTYELMAMAATGVRVWVDDQQVIDAWYGFSLKPEKAKVELTGKPQALRIDYHAAKGTAMATLRWTFPGSEVAVPIPTEALFYDRALAERTAVELAAERPLCSSPAERPQHGLLAELFAGTNFDTAVASRVDRRVDWLWGNDTPQAGLPGDRFSIRWTGLLRPPTPGEYVLLTSSDDGCRLYLDQQLVMDDWRHHATNRRGRKMRLEDRPYELKLEYYSQGGVACMSLRWIPPGETVEVPIPETALTPAGASAGAAPGQSPQPGAMADKPAAPAEGTKLPVPAEAGLEQARGLAQELFKQEYEQATTAEAKQALVTKIVEKAAAPDGTSEQRYVLFRLARDVALAADALPRALEAVDKTAERFAIDAFAEKTDILSKAARRAKTAEQHKSLAPKILEVLDQALADGAALPAKELLQLALSESGRLRGKDKELVQQVRARKEAVEDCVRAVAELESAREALARNPNDPKAKLAMGQWRCFARGEWQPGLLLLSQGDDAELKALADKELAPSPPAGEEAEKLADAWWDRSSREKGQRKEQLMRHAALWYHRVLEGSPSADARARIEKRLTATKALTGRKAAPPAAVAPFDSQQARRHQQTWADHLAMPLEITNSIGMKLTLIPPGQFVMGSSAEENKAAVDFGQNSRKAPKYLDQLASELPQHTVRITRPFYLAIYEVTQAEYQNVVGSNPSGYSSGGMNGDRVGGRDTSRSPVERVSWNDAVAFCQRLSALPAEKAAKRAYRLPTEAEWEYACRAGTTTWWFGGNEENAVGRFAWCLYNARGTPHPVGSKEANAWGLYDMLGNVSEWCLDFWSKGYYAQSPAVDPGGPNTGFGHVRRGGAWSPPIQCTSATRWYESAGTPISSGGLRVAVSPQ